VVLVLAVALSLILLVQHSRSFRDAILSRVENGIAQSSGARVGVGDFNLRLFPLTLEIYNLTVRGTETDPGRPLLYSPHILVGVTIDSLMHRKWHLRDVQVHNPVAHLLVNRDGTTNLPKSSKKSSGNNTNLFDLAIRRLVLDQGEVYYNDRKTPLEAELHNLDLRASYAPGAGQYSGTLRYDGGRIVYGDYAPMAHELDAAFDLTQNEFMLRKLDLNAGESHVRLTGAARNYSDSNALSADLSYDATLVTTEFRQIMHNPQLPTGAVRISGNLQYLPGADQPPLQRVKLHGELSSRSLAVKTSTLVADLRNLSGQYSLAGGNATLKDLHAELLGGTLVVNGVIQDVTGASRARVQAVAKNLSLDQLQNVTSTGAARQANLRGRLNANVAAGWAKSIKNLVARSNATLQATIGQNPATPLNSVIHASYSAAGGEVSFRQSYLRTPQTSVELNGTVSRASNLRFSVTSRDLHELELLSASLRPAAQNPQKQLALYGNGSVTGTVSGSLSNPQIQGQLGLNNLRVSGSSWKMLRAGFRGSPSAVSITSGQLDAVPRGQIRFAMQARLRHWKYDPSDPVQANVNASQLSIADLQRLAGKSYPVSGTLAMNVSLSGSQRNPAGTGTLSLTGLKISSEPVQSVSARFRGNGNRVDATLNVKMPAGGLQGTLGYMPATQGYQLQISAPEVQLQKLATLKQRGANIAGNLSFSASGRGTVKNPQLQAVLQIPRLQVSNQVIQALNFQTSVRDHLATLALTSNVAQTYIKASGTLGTASPYAANLRLDTGRIEFQPLLAMYSPSLAQDLAGATEMHATIKGPLMHRDQLQARLEIPELRLDYKRQVQLAASKPILVDYQNETVTLQPTSIDGTDTHIALQGNIPLKNRNAAAFLVQGSIDLRIAQLVMPSVQSAGQIQFDIDSRRFSPSSGTGGQIRIVNASVHSEASPVGLESANGVINVTRTRLEISRFEGNVGGGRISASGGLAYRPAIHFDLGLAADNVRLRYPEGIRTLFSSKLALTGSTEQSLLAGQVNIEHVSFTPDFDLFSFASQFGGESSGGGAASPVEQGMKLNIGVQSTSQMNLTSSTVSLQGTANLRVVGTAADPVILGRTNLASGELFYGNNRYQIQNSTIDFLNPVRTEPVLNLAVATKIQDYNITMNLRGPIDRLQTTYTSDPALPPVDIINLVARGQTTEAAAQTPSQPLAMGAQSFLASQLSSQVTGRIAKFAGISQLQVDPGLGSNSGQNPGARITVQQRVTSNLFVTFTTDVTSTQRQGVQVEYNLNRRWSLNGLRDQNGGFTVGGRYKKDF